MITEAEPRISSYKDLRVWRASIELAVHSYALTKAFPSSEIYGLTSQIRRSAVSIAANIAEGYGRENTGTYIQFLRIAQGSLKELETHLIIASRVGFLDALPFSQLSEQAESIGKMLHALIRSIQSSRST